MKLNELYEARAAATSAILELRDKSNDPSHTWDADNENAWTEANADYDRLTAEIDEAEAVAARDARAAELEARQSELRQSDPRIGRNTPGTLEPTDGPEITEETRSLAFQAWLRSANGMELREEHSQACKALRFNPRAAYLDVNLRKGSFSGPPIWSTGERRTAELRQQATSPDSAGGALVPQGFSYELERAMLAFNGPRQVSRVWQTSGFNPIDWPTVSDSGNKGRLLAENAAVTQTDIAYAVVQFLAYKYSSDLVLVSAELMEDSAFEMSSHVGSLLGERIGRITAEHFTTGTGSSQPTGCVTAAGGGITAASNAAIAPDELIDLQHDLDSAYRALPSCGYAMNDQTVAAVRKLKDTTNQYLWQPSYQDGAPALIAGFPYAVFADMADIGASAVSAMFAAWEKFVIRDHNQIRLYRLEELYRANDQTGFVAFSRHDSNAINAAALRTLTHPA